RRHLPSAFGCGLAGAFAALAFAALSLAPGCGDDLAGAGTEGDSSALSTSDLSCSQSPTRSNKVALNGSSGSGDIYVVAATHSGVAKVEFLLDGSLHRTDFSSPYDFNGSTTSGAAIPWNTTTMADGSHTIIARYHFSGGWVGDV